MTVHVDFKYNPGFKSDVELREQFVVRNRELKLLLEIIEENSEAASNRHVLLVGARGVGKTTLVRRIAAELRLEKKFSARWYPITLGEESYSVTSAGEFWLECIYHLQNSLKSERLKKRYVELKSTEDERDLLDGAIATLVEESRKIGRRFLVIVENLNALLETQMTPNDAWSFRHALQNHPEIMLLASATSTFDQIENDELALFEQFKVHQVQPLSARECRILWDAIADEFLTSSQIRPIQILTGGNPRLIRILAEFARDSIFVELVNKLAFLIDQYTDYFRSQLEILPTAERKVFVALLELWDPVPTREVAVAARMTPNVTSANLKRLQLRGAVVKEGSSWQAAERLFNIYYLMRRRGSPSSRVQALVRFMAVYYGKDGLPDRACALAREACELTPLQRADHFYAISEIMGQLDKSGQRNLIRSLPPAFLNAPDAPAALLDDIKALKGQTSEDAQRVSGEFEFLGTVLDAITGDDGSARARALIDALSSTEADGTTGRVARAYLAIAEGDEGRAEQLCREILQQNPSSLPAAYLLAWTLINQEKTDEAVVQARVLVDIAPELGGAWRLLGRSYFSLDTPNLSLAREAFEKAQALDPEAAEALIDLAEVSERDGDLDAADGYFRKALKLKDAPLFAFGQYGDFLLNRRQDPRAAEKIFRRMVKKWPSNPSGWARLGVIAGRLGRPDEAREHFARAFRIDEELLPTWVAYAGFLDQIDEFDEAKSAWQHATASPDATFRTWHRFGVFLRQYELWEEAEEAFRRAIECDPDQVTIWNDLGWVLVAQDDREDEAEVAFRELLNRSPDDCESWNAVGRFFESQGKFDEANFHYRRAIELNRGCSCAIGALLSERTGFGRDLPDVKAIVDNLVDAEPQSAISHVLRARYLRCGEGDLAGAERELALAFELKPQHRESFLEAIRLGIAGAENVPAAVVKFEKLVRKYQPCEHILNSIAWQIAKERQPGSVEVAIAAAKMALDEHPGNADIAHTLATALIRAREFDESLKLVELVIDGDGDFNFGSILDFLIEFAQSAPHYVPELLGVLDGAANAENFEPLRVAFRILGGEDVTVAKEIYEVALDIVEQIQTTEKEGVS